MSYQAPTFSRFRQAVLPVANWELRKFLPMALMIFITIFNFTLLRNAKDALFVTAPGSGAESITFLKLYGVLPMTILCSLLYVKLRKAVNFERSYYTIIGVFVSFFIIFALFLYPNHEMLHMDLNTVMSLKKEYPRFQHFFPVFGVWTYSLFYIFSELWGTFCLSILFWQFANDNVGPNEAKRFYPLLILTSNVATVVLGFVMKQFAKFDASQIITYSNIAIVILAAIMVYTFRWLNHNVLTDPKFTADISQKTKKSKVKMGFMDSIKQVVKSPYVGCIAMLVLSYGILINVIEVTWKSQLRLLFGDLKSYYNFMSTYTLWTGIMSMLFVFISKSIIRTRGWLTCAIVTPIIVGVTGIVFFLYMLFQDQFSTAMLYLGGVSPLVFAVWFGGIGVLISKSSKYSFFDPTKELAFIPLDYDLRMTGKAAADGVGGRLGKSGGGFIQNMLYMLTAGSQLDIAPYLAVIVVILSVVWLFSVVKLNKLYQVQLQVNDAGK